MIPIKSSFTKNGFVHELITRSGEWCVFRRGKQGARWHYEVIRPVVAKKANVGGVWVDAPPHEIYPSSESWGTNGFTLIDEESAIAKLAALTIQ